jgi:uncharacterized protein YcfL
MKYASIPIFARATSLLALSLALVACTQTPRGSQNSYRGQGGKLELERIEGNKLLASNLQIQNPIEKTVDGRKVAQFELKNTRSNAQRFAWAVDWFDEDGFRINDNARVFEPVSLGGYGSTYITITAPKAGERLSWKLTVTSPDEVR